MLSTQIMSLDRNQITERALNLVDEVGLDDLTVRRIATSLNVQPGALYRHFKDKDELLSDMAEHILRSEFPEIPDALQYAWNEYLVEVAKRYRLAMLSKRDGARIIARAHPELAITYGRLADNLIRKLLTSGFAIKQAATICATVLSYVEGMTQKEQGTSGQTHSEDKRLKALAKAKHSMETTKDEVFNKGLELIVAGIEAQRR